MQLGDPPQLGVYRLEGRLGEGGQGIVYLGRDAEGRQVAVKLLRSHLGQDEAVRARFARELAVIERVAGFCTAQVIDADVVADQPYIVSEYVPGPSLQQLVAEQGTCEGTELDRLAIGTATALAAIHRAGVVHRDFKPANVLMGPDGPRVIDFGIARALEAGADSTTASGVVGTPAFMAPEQIAGERVSPASDVFSWAATMAFAATGRSPFGGGSIPAVINRITQGEADLSGVPVALLPLLERCLAKDPAVRPTARQLMLTLIGEQPDTTTDDRSAGEPQPFPTVPVPPPPRRRRTGLVAGTAVGTALVLGAVAVGAWMYAPGRGRADSLALPTGGSEILKIASADAKAFESYDYRTFDADARSARSRMTSGLQQQYDSEMTTARPAALKQKIVNVASVVAAGIESTRGARATVLLSLDQRITRAGETPTASQAEVRAALVRRQGQWWLDQVTPLPAAPADLEGASWPGRKVSAVLKAAQSCIHAMYSVDHRAVDGTFTAVRACATGEFRNQWISSEAQLRSAYVTEQSVSRVTAIDVSLSASTGPSQATVLAAVGTEVRTKTTPSPTKKIVPPMQVTMNRVGGRWSMAKVAYVG
ncbi:serine/threonine-protein kinase [Actinoallomurus iriomotensis]|uniref:serine/threonine-protein kinase n=1 Tax=Actinoallomurus iriomotensis TaxID=478107 RepID=UPI00255284D2|nr:serine/threonine-protein kinase [Actinoallomurus iriomotensis]